ncbi:DUF397 domain-containing protein [Streptomyces sp. N2-109]|uniref:DUF397 domain-containing protein n=1 Tax=Streptomyces gossypii TaxID=2883101 RepID=A0ABT2K0N2_9ACTN|nr:DUF397 domain-containing protein [Streptomyces gossypii]MCT2592999.1 DUF397 domain-containing protein [Streptomyces gossypii]MCT2593732.1 DUF397 domain-containing protein [Streptomyces gossypii]
MNTHTDFGCAAWRTSSYSNGQANCVEVADGYADVLPVRDSKDPQGPALVFPADGWAAFVTAVKGGDLAA